MTNPDNTLDFFTILQKRDPFLASTYENVRKRSLDGWGNMFGKDHGSFTGIPHFRDVELNANRIVPDEVKNTFSTGEIFLLLNAIFLHDIGKTINKVKNAFDRCDQNSSCPNMENDQPKCQSTDKSHHVKSKEFILSHWAEIGLPDKKIAEFCAQLAFYHDLTVPPKVEQKVLKDSTCVGVWNEDKNFHSTSVAPYGKIRLPLLAAILRIADEADNSWLRALSESWNVVDEEDNVKAFRRYVGDVEFCLSGRCIIFHIPVVENEQKSRTEERNTEIEKKEDEFITCINYSRSRIEKMLSDPESSNKWGDELAHIGINFDDVYIEFNNHLLKEISSLHDNKPIPMVEIIGFQKKERLKKLFNALTELFFGSCGYDTFSWDIIEAQLGQPLESVDKWLVEKIADNSNDCIVVNDDKVHIRFANNGYSDLRNNVLGDDGGMND